MNTLTTLLGGEKLGLQFLSGETGEVFVRQLPIKDYPAYLACQQDELRQVELLCGQEKPWAETLTPESHESVITLGDKLNSDFFSRWLERKKKREAILPKFEMGEVVQMLEVLGKQKPELLDEIAQRALGTLPNSPSKLPSRVA